MRDIAIRNTHPSVVTINAETEAWDIDGDIVTLDESLIDVEILRLQAEHDSQEYSRNRKTQYNLLNQDEMRYDDLKNNTNTWELAIDAIKLEYPKETT